MDFQL